MVAKTEQLPHEDMPLRDAFLIKIKDMDPLPQYEIMTAFDIAFAAHNGQFRQSGEPYITHPIEAASYLYESGFRDPHLLSSALLHDVIEDTRYFADTDLPYTKRIQTARINMEAESLPQEVIGMVIALTKPNIDGIEITTPQERREVYLPILEEAVLKKPEIILIKMADRLHNLLTLDALSPEKQEKVLYETNAIYIPLFKKVLTPYPEGQHLLDLIQALVDTTEIPSPLS